MEYILVLLIVALLNGAIAYIDGLMEGIIPLTLYAEQYMSTLAGVDLFQSLFDIVFGFGVSLIVLKFLKKGFETYVLWSDGDADEEPIAILTNFFKAMAVAICFPTMYDWLATIVEEMSNKMLEAIGLATAYDWAGWVSGISSMGLVTAIFGLVFVIVYFILYFLHRQSGQHALSIWKNGGVVLCPLQGPGQQAGVGAQGPLPVLTCQLPGLPSGLEHLQSGQ